MKSTGAEPSFSLLGTTPKISYGISTVADGNMSFIWGAQTEVASNRVRFFARWNEAAQKPVVMRCDHAGHIATISKDLAGRGSNSAEDAVTADAFVTDEKALPLILLTGDCIPAIFFDPIANALALVHLSWKTTESKLARRTVELMIKTYGCDPSRLLVCLGPGIQANSYSFPDPIQKSLSGWGPFLRDLPDGTTAIDNFSYNKSQLLGVGVQAEHIEDVGIDTATDARFFSHYRSARTDDAEGRFATVVQINA